MKDEVIEATALKLGLPYDEVEMIVGSMFTSLKQAIREPHTCKRGIVLAKHFVIQIDYFRLVNQIHSLLLSDYRYTPRSEYRMRYWMEILHYIESVTHPRRKDWRLKKAAQLGIQNYDEFVERFDNYYDQISLLPKSKKK